MMRWTCDTSLIAVVCLAVFLCSLAGWLYETFTKHEIFAEEDEA